MYESLRENPHLPFYISIFVGATSILGYYIYKQVFSAYPAVPKTHQRARGPSYPATSVKKVKVADAEVKWSVNLSNYFPVAYTADVVKAKPVWADPDLSLKGLQLNWNALDGTTDRRSHMGHYMIVDGVPRNPVGRTGMTGRGLLGKWGPNHAADPIVTRWKRNENGEKMISRGCGKCILQFVCIQRKDSGEWAIPGGMVDTGESVSITLKKEFSEEALNSLDSSPSKKQHIQKIVDNFFSNGVEVYRGYVDDPRNTDNAWMETVAVNFHDETGDGVGKFKLHAGDDASKVQWKDIDAYVRLYASHSTFVSRVAELHNSHWEDL